jgi:UDP-glucose 4-epimerase/GDP-4-dehydro-6-deoxy-D-mannose reductase
MKIGITGSTGVLGKHLLKKLKQKKYRTVTFDHDIQEESKVKKWVKKNSFDAIFHLAAIVPVLECNDNPLKTCSINIGGIINILEATTELKKKPWFFYASTSHVYKMKKTHLSETDKIFPKTFYGFTKWMGEQVLENFSKRHNLTYCCGRIFSFYDELQSKDFLFPSIKNKISKLKNKNTVKIINAYNVIDIQKAENVAKIIVKLFEKKAKGIVNIGTGKGISVKNFAKRLTKKKITIDTKKHDKTYYVANIKKLNLIIKNG